LRDLPARIGRIGAPEGRCRRVRILDRLENTVLVAVLVPEPSSNFQYPTGPVPPPPPDPPVVALATFV
jgi:hypothetical protein